MNSSARIERARLLLMQSRYELAAAELRLALADDPGDTLAHALLAQCLTGMQKYAEAVEEAGQAIAAGPDLPFGHYALAVAQLRRNRLAEAEVAANEAIRLDPTDPDHHALRAAVRAGREDWAGTLVAANRGLEQDPEHQWCGNLRGMALVRLGRSGEAEATMAEALARDPDDAFTHANRGWGLLHEGDPARAAVHFREALRLDPELDFARAGMIEALKARYWVYRQVLGYFLWMSRLSPRARWGIVVGLIVLQQFVASTSRQNPALQPYLEPLLVAYLVFAVTSWTAVPLANLLLRLNRFGRHALSRDQRRGSNWVAGCVGLAVVAAGWGLFGPTTYNFLGWPVALSSLILVVPVSSTFVCQPGWPRRCMGVYAAGMAVLVAAVVVCFVVAVRLDGRDNVTAVSYARTGFSLASAIVWVGLGSALLANWLVGVRPRL